MFKGAKQYNLKHQDSSDKISPTFRAPDIDYSVIPLAALEEFNNKVV